MNRMLLRSIRLRQVVVTISCLFRQLVFLFARIILILGPHQTAWFVVPAVDKGYVKLRYAAEYA